jgi:hypothetical protein
MPVRPQRPETSSRTCPPLPERLHRSVGGGDVVDSLSRNLQSIGHA